MEKGRETWGATSNREKVSTASSAPKPTLSALASYPNTMPVFPIFWGRRCRLRRGQVLLTRVSSPK